MGAKEFVIEEKVSRVNSLSLVLSGRLLVSQVGIFIIIIIIVINIIVVPNPVPNPLFFHNLVRMPKYLCYTSIS